jgi:hypothetical protein
MDIYVKLFSTDYFEQHFSYNSATVAWILNLLHCSTLLIAGYRPVGQHSGGFTSSEPVRNASVRVTVLPAHHLYHALDMSDRGRT